MKRIKKYRAMLLVWLTHELALPMLKRWRKPKPFPYCIIDLKNMQPQTVGNELSKFIEAKSLELLPFYAQHDIKHLVLNYDTTEDGEVCLQCCMLGNGHVSFTVIATVLFGFCTMPEHWCKFITAFKRGKKAIALHHFNWYAVVD
jgi:ubiquinone biosynthesis protein Coq4